LDLRFLGDEFADDGMTLDDVKEVAKTSEATEQMDYLFTCAKLGGGHHVSSMYYPLAPFVNLFAGDKETVSVPAVAVGRINDPILAEQILANHRNGANSKGLYAEDGVVKDH